MASNVASTSLTQAINFLTRPLILIHAPDMINNLQHILRSTLNAAYPPSRNTRFTLSFSATSLPPRPIYAACIAAGIQWSDWMRLLSQHRAFDLLVEPNSVIVRFGGLRGQTIIVWAQGPLNAAKRSFLSQLNYEERQIPISKFAQHHPRRHRTLAQQLLDSNHEEEEADELFAMISDKTRGLIISPTPTREKFVIPSLATPFPIPIPVSFPSPLSSPEPSSRPSSRSSSTFSFSTSSEAESLTSVSSASLTPEEMSVPTEQPRVFIDNTKKEITKYMYQGGVSTVLTGGVMLGASSPKSKATRAPKFTPAAALPSWRRRV